MTRMGVGVAVDDEGDAADGAGEGVLLVVIFLRRFLPSPLPMTRHEKGRRGVVVIENVVLPVVAAHVFEEESESSWSRRVGM